MTVMGGLFVGVAESDEFPFAPRTAEELKAGRKSTVAEEAHRHRDGRETGGR